jgi:hypothetical protein
MGFKDVLKGAWDEWCVSSLSASTILGVPYVPMAAANLDTEAVPEQAEYNDFGFPDVKALKTSEPINWASKPSTSFQKVSIDGEVVDVLIQKPNDAKIIGEAPFIPDHVRNEMLTSSKAVEYKDYADAPEIRFSILGI